MKVLYNKTKIVATIGPACSSKETLTEMIKEGVNVCRVNFSHGNYADHQKVIDTIKEINKELNTFTALLLDLQGPKIRIGNVENNAINLIEGQTLTFTTVEQIGTTKKVYITYKEFPNDVNTGEKILLDDGKLILEVLETNRKNEVKTKVLHGGVLSSKKGVNLPNTKVSLPCLTPKDIEDLNFALKNDVSWIALSFVRNPNDIIELREILNKNNSDARIIAKIEKPEALENIDEIIKQADGCMVARGDLGVEIPMQDVPLVQKSIVRKCQKNSKPVIIATQMMESMISNITPTRAEVNDVANAVLDGADAVMLSGETSVGKYPVEVIKTMFKIIMKMETTSKIYYKDITSDPDPKRFVSDLICENATKLSKKADAKAIVTMSFSGYSGLKIASYRPKSMIFVFTANKKILTMVSLVWGVRAIHYDKFVSTDHTIDDIRHILKKQGFVKAGDIICNIASMPIASKGMSNMVKLTFA